MVAGRSSMLILASLGLAACATPEPAADEILEVPPFDDNFKVVANALGPTCGTLDCHAQVGRNLRFPGLNTAGASGAQQDPLAALYWAIVGLEPEVLSTVTREGGADPERLALFRKARGNEKHEGGALMFPGDDLDSCLLSWVQKNVDATPCELCTCSGDSVCVAPCPRVICDLSCRRRRVQVLP